MPLEHTYYHVQAHCRSTFAYSQDDRLWSPASPFEQVSDPFRLYQLHEYRATVELRLPAYWSQPGAFTYSHQLSKISEPLQLASFIKDRTSLPVLLFDPLAKQVNQHPMPRISFRLQGGVVFTQGYDVATTNHPAVISPTQHSPRLISLQTLTSVWPSTQPRTKMSISWPVFHLMTRSR